MKLLGLQQAFTFELVLAARHACRHAPRRRAGAPRRHGAIPPARAPRWASTTLRSAFTAPPDAFVTLWLRAAAASVLDRRPVPRCMARSSPIAAGFAISAAEIRRSLSAHLCASLANSSSARAAPDGGFSQRALEPARAIMAARDLRSLVCRSIAPRWRRFPRSGVLPRLAPTRWSAADVPRPTARAATLVAALVFGNRGALRLPACRRCSSSTGGGLASRGGGNLAMFARRRHALLLPAKPRCTPASCLIVHSLPLPLSR